MAAPCYASVCVWRSEGKKLYPSSGAHQPPSQGSLVLERATNRLRLGAASAPAITHLGALAVPADEPIL
jgi:hypothetical protein